MNQLNALSNRVEYYGEKYNSNSEYGYVKKGKED
jgi:hypothetical protein